MKSTDLSRREPFRRLGGLLLALAMAVAACGGGGSPCGEGNDGVPTIIDDESDLNTFVVGRLGVGELNQLTGPDPGHTTLVQAFFSDFSNYQVQLADRQYFSEACWLYTSRQVTSGEPIDLGVQQVVVQGLAGGDLVLPGEGDPPQVSPAILDGRVFTESPVSFTVDAPDETGYFPAFSDSLPAPEPVVITRLGDREQPDMGQGPSIGIDIARTEPLQVHWQAGSGDYFEVRIIPGAGSDTKFMKLRCVTFDDGCLSIPPEALAALVPDKASNFQFKAERHNFTLHSIKEADGTVRAAALIDVSSVLEATVLR